MKFLCSWLYHTARKRAGAFLWTQLCRKAPDLLRVTPLPSPFWCLLHPRRALWAYLFCRSLRVSRFLLEKLLHK